MQLKNYLSAIAANSHAKKQAGDPQKTQTLRAFLRYASFAGRQQQKPKR
jgi:hypothetical protein